MPSIQERIVAGGRGVWAERHLAEAASDFYVLELLTEVTRARPGC